MDWAQFVADNIPSPKTVSVEAYEGSGGYGDTYGAAVDVEPCVVFFDHKRVPVTTGDAAGKIAISTAQVWCPPGTVAPPGSYVTLPGSGGRRKVLLVDELDAHGWDLPEHVELALE